MASRLHGGIRHVHDCQGARDRNDWPCDGDHTVAHLTSSQAFKVLPAITSFTPTIGPVGRKVTITGSGFIGATKVTFGGVKAISFTVSSGTQITATVPTGAKTGNIAVTTPGGTGSKGIFTVS